MSLKEMNTRKTLLENLNQSTALLLDLCATIPDPDTIVYEGWTIKAVMGHMTFWHESFARNVYDLANDREPTPLRGTYSALNQKCLAEFGPLSIEVIVLRFANAHKLIQENILNDKIVMIPYRKGSRDYPPEEHLQVVNDHLKEHTKDIVTAINNA